MGIVFFCLFFSLMCSVSRFQPTINLRIMVYVLYCLCAVQRLKNWELRERKKARDYAKETERDDERRRETVREFSYCFCLVKQNVK